MRINVYAEELTDEVEIVTKDVTDERFGERTFYGLRVYLKSPPELHAHRDDDDRSAITFWIAWTRKEGHNPRVMHELLKNLDGALDRMLTQMVGRGEEIADFMGFAQDIVHPADDSGAYMHPTRSWDDKRPSSAVSQGTWTLP